MIDTNNLTVNQQEMCRLVEHALKSLVLRDGVAVTVTKVSVTQKSYGGEEFIVEMTAAPKVQVQA